METIMLAGSYTASREEAKIRRLSIDPGKGTVKELAPATDGVGNPIYFALNRAKTRLYAARSFTPESGRTGNGTISVYALDSTLAARELDSATFDFTVPCHISLSHDEKRLYFAEYSMAHAGFVPLDGDGLFLKDSAAVVRHSGSGPNKERQESAHCHQALESPCGKYLFVCDLGIDKVVCYGIKDGGLERVEDGGLGAPAGYGPRHMVFNGAGDRAYIVYELASKVQALRAEGARLIPMGSPISMLGENAKSPTKAAAIRLSPSGKWLLASNRGDDSIAAFRVREDGSLMDKPVISPLDGAFPRDFAFIGKTDALIAGHKLSDSIALYRFSEETGDVRRTSEILPVPKPLAFIG